MTANNFSQTLSSDSTTVPRKWTISIDYGSSISIGPEYLPLSSKVYGANVNYRFWLRTVTEKRQSDNILNISAGYFRQINKNIIKLKFGDLILLREINGYLFDLFSFKLRLGIFADYLYHYCL